MISKLITIDKREHERRSQAICEWLGEHPHISRHSIATEVGLAAQNLHDAIGGGRKIPKKYLAPIEQILVNYGFKR